MIFSAPQREMHLALEDQEETTRHVAARIQQLPGVDGLDATAAEQPLDLVLRQASEYAVPTLQRTQRVRRNRTIRTHCRDFVADHR